MDDVPQEKVTGVLFRGADGNLYFIPDQALESKLKPFRVFDSARERIEGHFVPPAEGAAPAVEAVHTTIPFVKPAEGLAQPPQAGMIIFIAYLEEEE